MKTIVIYGMLRKTGRTVKGDYADIDLVYNVDDSVSVDDVRYFIDKLNVTAIPANTKGEKLSYVIGMDSERQRDAQVKTQLNRIGLQRYLKRDVNNLDWHKDKRRG